MLNDKHIEVVASRPCPHHTVTNSTIQQQGKQQEQHSIAQTHAVCLHDNLLDENFYASSKQA